MAQVIKQMDSRFPETEKLFHSIVENALTGIVIIDDSFTILYGNDTFFKISGLSRKDLIGKDFRQFVDERDRSMVVDRYVKRQKGIKVARQYEIKVVGKKGNHRDLQLSSTVIENPDGKKVTVVQLLDITDKKQAEEELKRKENKYRNIFNNISDFIYIHDMDGNFIETNYQSIGDVGFDENDIKNACIRDFIPKQLQHKFDDYMEEIKLNGHSKGLIKIIAKDSKERVLEYRSSLAHNPENPSTVRGIARDVTELIHTRKALQKLSHQLEIKVEERTKEIKEMTESLKEVNTALKVFWKKRDEAKDEAENKFLFNLKELLVPYIEKLLKSNLTVNQRVYVDIIRSNLNDIASPFITDLYSKYWNLSPTEIQIANFIKNGRATKEIADLLYLSTSTIESHRKNIRKKIGLTNKKTNLRTHLLSITRK